MSATLVFNLFLEERNEVKYAQVSFPLLLFCSTRPASRARSTRTLPDTTRRLWSHSRKSAPCVQSYKEQHTGVIVDVTHLRKCTPYSFRISPHSCGRSHSSGGTAYRTILTTRGRTRTEYLFALESSAFGHKPPQVILESQERPSPLSSRSYLPSFVHEEYFPEFVWKGPQSLRKLERVGC